MKIRKLLAKNFFLTIIFILCSCCGGGGNQEITAYDVQSNVTSSEPSSMATSNPSSFSGSWSSGQDSYLDFLQDHSGYFTEKIGGRAHIKSFKWEKNSDSIKIHCYLWEVMEQRRCVIGREISETKYIQIVSPSQLEMDGKYYRREY